MSTAEALIEALQLSLVIDTVGTKRYYNNENELHREFGPAVVYTNSDKMWYLNDMLHRTDGPAIERADGYKECWINDQHFIEEDFLSHPLCKLSS